MNIYSWNMLYRNRELDLAFDFISKSDFDIFCLQEVPGAFLARLQTLPCHLVSHVDTEKVLLAGIVTMYSVILSKHPISAQGEIPLDDCWSLLPLYTRLFVFLMRPLHFSQVQNRAGLYADIRWEEKTIRVFNLHLALAYPALRLKEFETAMVKLDPATPTIVCGDFNILEKPHITPLNWLLGGRVTDALLYTRERTTIEKRFVEHELTNALRGKVTHRLSRSQLDHILVSRSFSIQNAEVIPDRLGSDHHPICVGIV